MPTFPEAGAADARAESQTSIYLTAALYSDGLPTSAKIRNLSATGALVDVPVIPAAGALVQLIRGSLIAHAIVTWSADHHCGLKFSGRIDVDHWRAAPVNAEQHRIDEAVRLIKASAMPLTVPARSASEPEPDCPETELADHLELVTKLLGTLGDALAGDPGVVMRHGDALQNLDIAMQSIAAVSAVVAALGPLGLRNAKLAALRKSAEQACGPPLSNARARAGRG